MTALARQRIWSSRYVGTSWAPRCLRVGHSIVKPGSGLDSLAARLHGATWDMVELDVLTREGELVVAHDPGDLTHPESIRFADALVTL